MFRLWLSFVPSNYSSVTFHLRDSFVHCLQKDTCFISVDSSVDTLFLPPRDQGEKPLLFLAAMYLVGSLDSTTFGVETVDFLWTHSKL